LGETAGVVSIGHANFAHPPYGQGAPLV